MKNIIVVILILTGFVGYPQKSNKKSSFLSRNKPVKLFSDISILTTKTNNFELILPKQEEDNSIYQSGFRNFMVTDSRMLNYPAADLSENNQVIFGSYTNTNVNIGNTKLTTFYIFDQSGRLVDTTASFSFGKKK